LTVQDLAITVRLCFAKLNTNSHPLEKYFPMPFFGIQVIAFAFAR